MIPSLEGWPTKAKEAPSPHEVRLTPLDTNPVFDYLSISLYVHWLTAEHIIKDVCLCPWLQKRITVG